MSCKGEQNTPVTFPLLLRYRVVPDLYLGDETSTEAQKVPPVPLLHFGRGKNDLKNLKTKKKNSVLSDDFYPERERGFFWGTDKDFLKMAGL